jgi:uncharacterized protein
MPVRSSGSSVLRWPSRHEVERSVRAWAVRAAATRPDTLRIGYFGSLARGDWGVGSDVDLLVIVDRSEAPFERRAAAFDTNELPVPADLLVYTAEEWAGGLERPGLIRTADRDAVWVFEGRGE